MCNYIRIWHINIVIMQAKVQSQDQHQCRLEEDAAAKGYKFWQAQILVNLVSNSTIAKISAKQLSPQMKMCIKVLQFKTLKLVPV